MIPESLEGVFTLSSSSLVFPGGLATDSNEAGTTFPNLPVNKAAFLTRDQVTYKTKICCALRYTTRQWRYNSNNTSVCSTKAQECLGRLVDNGKSPVNTRHRTNVGLMLGQARIRWANIKPELVQCLAFAGRPTNRPIAERQIF